MAQTSTMDAARTTFVSGLRSQHAVEVQAAQLIERQLDRIENYPDVAARLRQHLDETNEQKQRIEQILDRIGESHSALKDTAMGFMGNMAALAHAPAQDEILKNSFANFAFENFEIASYKGLLVVCRQAGSADAGQLLERSLKEEQAMADWIDKHLEQVVTTYLERDARGEEASH